MTDNEKDHKESNQTMSNFENHIISITTEADNAVLGVDILGPYKKESEKYETLSDFNDIIDKSSVIASPPNSNSFNSLYGLLFSDEDKTSISSELSNRVKESNTKIAITTTTTHSPTTQVSKTSASIAKPPAKNLTSNAIPLKLITILNNTKKESPTKIEIPQRKNNKIIDPTDESLLDDANLPLTTTEMTMKPDSKNNENLTTHRDVFLSSLNRPSSDISEELLHKSPLFLSRPIKKHPPYTNLNLLESKHNFQSNPIRSELDLIISEFNKNKQSNDPSHTNNFNSESYQVLTADDKNIANTESYVVNPVDLDKLKKHQSNGETEIFTPPHKDPVGLLKLAGCNIYGRMYRVGRIIAELSSNCIECRCTEVGVSCTPLSC